MDINEKEKIPKIIRKDSYVECSDLYSFQNNIPEVKFIPVSDDFNKSHSIRSVIMEVLREGIEDEFTDPKTMEHFRIRYALTAREIRMILKEKKKKDIGYTNLYFHINKLLEIGSIKIVAMVIERSHRIAYYGRSAKIILVNDPEKGVDSIGTMFKQFYQLMQVINSEIKIDKVDDLSMKYFNHIQQRNKKLAYWLADHESIIREKKLSLPMIFKMLQLIDNLNPVYIEIFRVFADHLLING